LCVATTDIATDLPSACILDVADLVIADWRDRVHQHITSFAGRRDDAQEGRNIGPSSGMARTKAAASFSITGALGCGIVRTSTPSATG
jgi:hypothetical protein